MPAFRHSPLLALTAIALLGACSPGTRVARIDPNTTVDLSGDWNDADSKLVADEMIRDALTTPWATRYMQTHGGKAPKVIVGTVRNKSSEHINVATFVQDMVAAFVRSGAVTVVASGDERSQVRAERQDQQSNASADTRARIGAEQGADFMLVGEVNTIVDQEGGRAVKFYQIDLRLTDMESNAMTWTGQKKIKKFVERSGVRGERP